MIGAEQLRQANCRHTTTASDEASIAGMLEAVPGWQRDGQRIVREFGFNNYYETLAFVNALAFIVHAQDHHPELVVTYACCTVKFDTHSVNDGRGGLSDNDFICAARIDALYAARAA
ncbi:4a-hydroxytetrahydrobiopterin dehydratase [Lacisediminimonas sp.]|uniref:4a-hydroxytetrahydrobiopterin dehydratase n=1 Tax=Lacisediminimonas sp. TaxID=3060582 RepID=UPI0027247445|nr:4a-hydroxytetrahydrobiopterin dehydratase [Lacisediminimonas sp.]MDO8298345.1 4a-hydroxytetrahydrobiopterin dehydratase [Lacisediminimonas sp.]